MPFDPTSPKPATEIDANELRAQFNALNDLITAQAAQIAALQTAVADSAHNPNLGTLNLSLDDPPTRPEVQAMLDQLNTLLNQLTRV